MHLDFFRLHTIKDLPGSNLGLPWSEIILSAVSSIPPVGHAVVALSCMHRTLFYSHGSPQLAPQSYASAFEAYHKAIVGLRKYTDETSEACYTTARETTLMVSLLLFCFEVLCGQKELALAHLEGALNLIWSEAEKVQPHNRRVLVLSSKSREWIDVLNHIFLRLASDWLVPGPIQSSSQTWPLYAICSAKIPTSFQTHLEAFIHLDVLCSHLCTHYEDLYKRTERQLKLQATSLDHNNTHECVKRCWVAAVSLIPDEQDGSTIAKEVNQTVAAFRRWLAAFSSSIASNPRARPMIMLEIQFLHAWISLHTLQDHDQSICDVMEEDLEKAMSLAEQYVFPGRTTPHGTDENLGSESPLPELGNRLALCVGLVIEKSRDSHIRWRGIQVLSALGFHGTFDTPYLVAYYTKVVEQEEMRARAVNLNAGDTLLSRDVPTRARFRKTGICSCRSHGGSGTFRKLHHGRMIYIEIGDSGTLSAGVSKFQIEREQKDVGQRKASKSR